MINQQQEENLSPEQQESKKKVHKLNQELHQMTQQIQRNIVSRLSLEEKIQGCLNEKCFDFVKKAEVIIEDENTKGKQNKDRYTKDPKEYFNSSYQTIDKITSVMDAEECIKKCHRPRDIISKVFEQNLGAFYQNVQLCFKDCEKVYPEKLRETDFTCVAGCLESNIAILKQVDKKLNDEFVMRIDSLY